MPSYTESPLILLHQSELVKSLTPSVSSHSFPSSFIPHPSASTHSVAASKHNLLLTAKAQDNVLTVIESNLHYNHSFSLQVVCSSPILPAVSIFEHKGRTIDISIVFFTSSTIYKLEAVFDRTSLRSCTSLASPRPSILHALSAVLSYPLTPKSITLRSGFAIDHSRLVATSSSNSLHVISLAEDGITPSLSDLKFGSLLKRTFAGKTQAKHRCLKHYRCLGTDYLIVIDTNGIMTVFNLRSRVILIEYDILDCLGVTDVLENALFEIVTDPKDPNNVRLFINFEKSDHFGMVPSIYVFALKFPADPKRIKKPQFVAEVFFPETCQNLNISKIGSTHDKVLVYFDSVKCFQNLNLSTNNALQTLVEFKSLPKCAVINTFDLEVSLVGTFVDWMVEQLITILSFNSHNSSALLKYFLRDCPVTNHILIDAVRLIAPTFPINSDTVFEVFPKLNSFLCNQLGISPSESVERIIIGVAQSLYQSFLTFWALDCDPKLNQSFLITSDHVICLRSLLPVESSDVLYEELAVFGQHITKFAQRLDFHAKFKYFKFEMLSQDFKTFFDIKAYDLGPLFLDGLDFFPLSSIVDIYDIFDCFFNIFSSDSGFVPSELAGIDISSYFFKKNAVKPEHLHSSHFNTKQIISNILNNLISAFLYLACLVAPYSPIDLSLKHQLNRLFSKFFPVLRSYLAIDLVLNYSPMEVKTLVRIPEVAQDFSRTPVLETPSAQNSIYSAQNFKTSPEFLSQRALAVITSLSFTDLLVKSLVDQQSISNIQQIFKLFSSSTNPSPILLWAQGHSYLFNNFSAKALEVFGNLCAQIFVEIEKLNDFSTIYSHLNLGCDLDSFYLFVSEVAELINSFKLGGQAAQFVHSVITSFPPELHSSLIESEMIDLPPSSFEKLKVTGFRFAMASGLFSQALYFLNLMVNGSQQTEAIRLMTNSVIASGQLGLFSETFISESILQMIVCHLLRKLNAAKACTDGISAIIFDGVKAGFSLHSVFCKRSDFCPLQNFPDVIQKFEKFSKFQAYDLRSMSLNNLVLANCIEGQSSDLFFVDDSDHQSNGSRRRRVGENSVAETRLDKLPQSNIIDRSALITESSNLRLKLIYNQISDKKSKSKVSPADFLFTSDLSILEEVLVYAIKLKLDFNHVCFRIGSLVSEYDLNSPENSKIVAFAKKILGLDSADLNFAIHAHFLKRFQRFWRSQSN
ncbi:hypothetical protein GEMRC1_006149 [Eukaryota sp. GEM-RC1]